MKYIKITLAIACMFAMSCATATFTNFETGEQFTGTFTDGMGTGGKCKVTMPDGQELKGRYSGLRGHESISFGSGSANTFATASNGNSVSAFGNSFGSTYSAGGRGTAHAMLKSTTPGSKLMMEIWAKYNTVSGGGFGEARTNDGRTYSVDF